jgi:hypothetical protein
MANDFSPYIPEWWAMETIRVLKNKMVAANLVHRDFEMQFQKFGDIVNTRKPRTFVAKHKDPGDDVTVQNAISDNIAVPLDQHVHVSFEVEDEFDGKSMKDLIDEYIEPAAIALAEDVDGKVLNQLYHFAQYQAGSLGGLTNANAVDYLTELGRVMTVNKVPQEGRQLILNPYATEKMLQNATFHQADRLGDAGTALREASLGRKLGFDIYNCQGSPYLLGSPQATTDINNGNLAAGSTVITVTDATGMAAGDWLSVGGNVYQIASVNSADITLTQPLVKAIIDTTPVLLWPETTTNLGGTLAAGWRKYITLTSATEAQVGRLVSFGTSTVKYAIREVNGSDIRLDRPLEASLGTGVAVKFGPTGGFNFSFVKQALALVLRPLKPETEFGSKSATISFDGIPMRAEISRDARSQKKLVTLDFLMGLEPLDAVRGAVLLT